VKERLDKKLNPARKKKEEDSFLRVKDVIESYLLLSR
jgi:hypothetical protein